ncbi:MAG TPA: basic amino acid/polyamine antiporter [Proteiniphilum sp.]|nr:basic amino acid/polyamine antiporter [Proteiniphilum sp.]HPD87242.1 basic amino acid/polyamine antiporter [Proteiniphilum sp.]HPJ50197.1 basic amino acid/polyamine antiporter [Proteiniphilum sp.]HPR19599.1 basic amino acid/polyamine antiporter [Proteiniphilum sp.]
MKAKDDKLGLWLLIFVALGSMIGSGIFNSPRDLISVANPQGTLITWVIGGFGALMLALVFVYLAGRKPELKSGVYAYARDGFGDYMGFNSAWGYWSVGWLGNVSYLALFFKTLNDLLGERALSPLTAFLIGSALLWSFHAILMAGIREGAILNFVVTAAKLIPILLIILLGFALVRSDLFMVENWQRQLASTGGDTTPLMQVKEAMAVVLWCFVGIEAASVLSGRAKSQRTVRLSIIISLLVVLSIYMLVTFIAMSSVPAHELAASETPLALVLERTAIGAAGGLVIRLGIMISVLGASISWILLSVETLYAAARDGVLPRVFQKTNRKGTPVNALLMTQCFTQLFLLSILSPRLNETYLAAITIATTLVLIPYLLSSLYAVKTAFSLRKQESSRHLVIALLGTLYSLYVIYAVGLRYLILSVLFYGIGSLLFLRAKREQRKQPKPWEWAVIILLLGTSALIAGLLLTGRITL